MTVVGYFVPIGADDGTFWQFITIFQFVACSYFRGLPIIAFCA